MQSPQGKPVLIQIQKDTVYLYDSNAQLISQTPFPVPSPSHTLFSYFLLACVLNPNNVIVRETSSNTSVLHVFNVPSQQIVYTHTGDKVLRQNNDCILVIDRQNLTIINITTKEVLRSRKNASDTYVVLNDNQFAYKIGQTIYIENIDANIPIRTHLITTPTIDIDESFYANFSLARIGDRHLCYNHNESYYVLDIVTMDIKLRIDNPMAIKEYGPYLLVCVENELRMYNSNDWRYTSVKLPKKPTFVSIQHDLAILEENDEQTIIYSFSLKKFTSVPALTSTLFYVGEHKYYWAVYVSGVTSAYTYNVETEVFTQVDEISGNSLYEVQWKPDWRRLDFITIMRCNTTYCDVSIKVG